MPLILSELVAEVERDPASLGLILHGSRASGAHRPDSDFDLIWIVTDDEHARREAAGTLFEQREPPGVPKRDILYQSPSRLRWHAANPGSSAATYASAQMLADKTGEVETLVRAIAAAANEQAWREVPETYDVYLSSFVRSLKAWRRTDDLGGRLHAAESALHLVRLLFGVERRWPPYHDQLADALPALEQAQGWEPGSLAHTLSRLLEHGRPELQQEVELRVEALLRARGFEHQFGWSELEPLKALRFGRAG